MDILDLRDLADEYDELVEKLDSEDESFCHEDQTRLFQLKKLEKDLDRSLRDAADEEPILVPECEWVDYCQELADDCGYLPRAGNYGRDHNPLMDHIDWKSWADAVAQDYSTVEFEGTTYYYRNY